VSAPTPRQLLLDAILKRTADLDHASYRILTQLWRHDGREGCFPSVTTLANSTGISVSSVRRVTSEEACERFHAAVTAAADGETVPRAETSAVRERRLHQVDAELTAAGI